MSESKATLARATESCVMSPEKEVLKGRMSSGWTRPYSSTTGAPDGERACASARQKGQQRVRLATASAQEAQKTLPQPEQILAPLSGAVQSRHWPSYSRPTVMSASPPFSALSERRRRGGKTRVAATSRCAGDTSSKPHTGQRHGTVQTTAIQ